MSSLATGQDSSRAFYWIVGIFVTFQVLKFLFLVPEAETGGDAAQKWDLARDIANGSLEVFRSHNIANHHYLRWATWALPAFLIWLINDSVVVYYLSTILPSTIAGVIFFGICFRNLGMVPTVILAVIWYFDPQLYRATFQLLPTGAGLLPLAIIVLTFQRFIDGRMSESLLAGLMSFWLFWLYGVKETNVFFAPGIFFSVWVLAGARHAFSFVFIFLVLYLIEAAVLSAMLGGVMLGGRLLELLLEESQHLKLMFETTRLINEQEALWDAGIISRWYTVFSVHVPIYIPSIVAFLGLSTSYWLSAPSNHKDKLVLCISLTGLSFVLLTSFFIVSLDPVRLGQPIRARYLAILLPLSVFVLLYVITQWWLHRRSAGMAVVVTVITFACAIGYVLVDGHSRHGLIQEAQNSLLFRNSRPLSHWTGHYEQFGEQLPGNFCSLERRALKKLYFGLMFVSRNNSGPERRSIVKACPQTKDFIFR